MSLNLKQQRFVEEYLADPNGTQAAIRAGYSPRSARQHAHRMLSNADISEAISEARAELAEKTGVNPELIMEEYRRIAFSDIRDVVTWEGRTVNVRPSEELAPDAARALSEISETETETAEGHIRRTRRVKLHDKLGALRDAAKMLGMFPREGAGVNVNVNVDNRPAARPLSEFTDEELDFYERLLRPSEELGPGARNGHS